MASTDFKVEGMDELIKNIKTLEALPKKHVTRAAKSGAKIALNAAKNNAPFLSGDLEKGIMLKAERTKVKAKKVYDVTMNPAMNDVFQTKGKDGDVVGYYPASQEYGFITRGGGYVPGLHFLRRSLTEHVASIEKTMVDVMLQEIEKIKAK